MLRPDDRAEAPKPRPPARRHHSRVSQRCRPRIDCLEVRITPSTSGLLSSTLPAVIVRPANAPATVVATTVGLARSADPSLTGQVVTFTATIEPLASGAGQPYGSVSFYDGTTLLGTSGITVLVPPPNTGFIPFGGVTESTATLTTSALVVGDHPITAVYSGDSYFGGSTSPAITQTVAPTATTTTTVTVAPNPTIYGQAVLLTATIAPVSPGSGLPYGTITFYDGSNALGTVTIPVIDPVAGQPLPTSTTATLITSSLLAGNHPITAVYSGNSVGLTSSTSAPVSQTVSQATTRLDLNTSANPSTAGQYLILTATITPAVPESGTLGGTVSFYDGTTLIGTATPYPYYPYGIIAIYPPPPAPLFNATLYAPFLSVGHHSIHAVYTGEANVTGSSSNAIDQSITQATSQLSISVSPSPSTVNQPVTITAVASSSLFPAGSPPTGYLTFYDGGTILGTAPLSYVNPGGPILLNFNSRVGAFDESIVLAGPESFATLTTTSLPIGHHAIYAIYSGDTNFRGTASNTVAETVNPASTFTQVASTQSPSVVGQSVSLLATIRPVGSVPGNPLGTVSFYDGATLLGTVPIPPGQHVGSANYVGFTTSTLSAGHHQIRAIYNGDGAYVASASALFDQTVVSTQSSVTLTSSSPTAVYGQPLTYTATVAPGIINPTGLVVFYDGPTQIGAANLVGGRAEVHTTAISAGQVHSIRAVYVGGGFLQSSVSAPFIEAVIRADSALTVSTATTHRGIAFVTTVSTVSPGSGVPTGTVTLYVNGRPHAKATLVGGQATVTFRPKAAAPGKSFVVKYSGDINTNAGESRKLGFVKSLPPIVPAKIKGHA